jgi:predicted HicB family RNase H-like nuclease
MSKKNTSTITFRIDEDFDKHLRKIAKEQKISLNILANQIFGKYLDLDVYMEKFDWLKC